MDVFYTSVLNCYRLSKKPCYGFKLMAFLHQKKNF
jgi:hypothetical protein